MAEYRPPEDPYVFRAALESYRDLLDTGARRLDVVNVYPVPDYDTGSNLRWTVGDAFRQLDPNPAWSALAPSVARGSLMSCRGNAGVIFSQAIRGLVTALAGGSNVREALRDCSDAAQKAVMRPVRGTILTVLEAATEGADAGASQDSSAQLMSAIRFADRHLSETHRELTLLHDAVVIDAGGLGILLFLDAWALASQGIAPPHRRGVIMHGPQPDWRRLAESMCDALDTLFITVRGEFQSAPATVTQLLEAVAVLASVVRKKVMVSTPEEADDVRLLAVHTRATCEELGREDLGAPHEVVERARAALARSLIVLDGAA